MTLISETIFKRFSSRPLLSQANKADGPGSTLRDGIRSEVLSEIHSGPMPLSRGCLCRVEKLLPRPSVANSLSDKMRKRLGRLITRDIEQLEKGKNPAKLSKRGKAMAHLAQAIKDMAIKDLAEIDHQRPFGGSVGEPATPHVPLGVEAFRMALAKELTLIRHKKENIP